MALHPSLTRSNQIVDRFALPPLPRVSWRNGLNKYYLVTYSKDQEIDLELDLKTSLPHVTYQKGEEAVQESGLGGHAADGVGSK